MNPEQNEMRLRVLLRTGAKKPGELQQALGISQPTLSRLVRRAGPDVVMLGATRSTLYALASSVPGIGPKIPLFRVEVSGNVRPHGALHCLAGSQYYWETATGGGTLYDYLPWFIQNLRPEGFLGRAFAIKHQGLGLPGMLENWNDHHLLTALVKAGTDLPGDLIVGEESLNAYLATSKQGVEAISQKDRAIVYPKMARDALAGSPPGSSAGGEQPKFGVLVNDNGLRHVLVKFSPPVGTAEGRRWSDLLVCEHLALQTLIEAGRSAATSRVWQYGERQFLEVDRFDRIGRFGRRGLVTLGVLEDEFFGVRDNWTGAANRMAEASLLSLEDASAIRWQAAFGKMIANTDQHFGNISLFVDGTVSFRLCPAYDVLPMFYRPTTTGEVVERQYEMPVATVGLAGEWVDAQEWAEVFWQRVAEDDRISQEFREIAYGHAEELAAEQGPRLIL